MASERLLRRTEDRSFVEEAVAAYQASSKWDRIWPTRGARIGINVETIGGSGLTYDQTITAHEQMIGRRVDGIHNYHWLSTTFPNQQELDRTVAGQMILTSVQSRNGSGIIPWADVAVGKQDAAIRAYAAGVKSLAPRPVMVNWINEPDLQTTEGAAVGATNTNGFTALGSTEEFRKSYQRFVQIFRDQGVDNAIFVLIYAGIATTNKQRIAQECWPGADYVDAVGWDPYTRTSDSGGLKTFVNTVSPWYTWAKANLPGAANLPFMLTEYGCEEHASDALFKYQWFLDGAAAIEAGTFPDLKWLWYFDHTTDGSGVWNLKSTAQSRAGYRQLAERARNPHRPTQDPAEVFRTGDWHFAGSQGSAGTSNTLGNGSLRVSPLDVPQPLPISDLSLAITAGGTAGCTMRLGIYADDGTGTYPGALVLDAGTVAADAIAVPAISSLTTLLLPGRYWVGAVLQGAPASQPTVRTFSNSLGRVTRIGTTAPTSSTSVPVAGWAVTGVTGALPSTFPAVSGATQPGTVPLLHFKVG